MADQYLAVVIEANAFVDVEPAFDSSLGLAQMEYLQSNRIYNTVKGRSFIDLECADDVAIFAQSSTKLRHVVSLVLKLAAAYGLRLRPDKCKQLWISSRTRKEIGMIDSLSSVHNVVNFRQYLNVIHQLQLQLSLLACVKILQGNIDEKMAQNRSRSGKNKIIPRSITKTVHSNGSITYNLLAITDMDEAGREAKDKYNWRAVTRNGTLTISQDKKTVTVNWLESSDKNITSGLNYKGRAMELSDLSEYNGHLLSPDDKTGLLYEIKDGKAIPWVFLNSGPGNTTKGMKAEWLTVKDDLLYVGGHGTEYRDKTGAVVSEDSMWIKTITKTGKVRSENWKDIYTNMRDWAGYHEPGYLTHEAVQWSEIRKKWYFLPRKASKTIYNETEDEKKGAHILIEANPELNLLKVINVKDGKGSPKYDPEKGFSAFDFIPNTDDELILAIKSKEVTGSPPESYITVFNVNGTVLLPDQILDGNLKFEGIYFV
ncbi:hypothetical protein RB195_003573 [Necator americanus]|uniref:Apyrase n=2 Tax=Necator americanus TaxID=51031 RepID=A0ABR1DPF4_NECAM